MIHRILTVILFLWCLALTAWSVNLSTGMTEVARYSGEVARVLTAHTSRLVQQEDVLIRTGKLSVVAFKEVMAIKEKEVHDGIESNRL